VLKKLKGHNNLVEAMVVSGDGKLIASGDKKGGLIGPDTETLVNLLL
jgi:hypothetical protein